MAGTQNLTTQVAFCHNNFISLPTSLPG